MYWAVALRSVYVLGVYRLVRVHDKVIFGSKRQYWQWLVDPANV